MNPPVAKYVIVWTYDVIEQHVTLFEKAYAPDGTWAQFFRQSPAYLGTELYADEQNPQRYMTVDYWQSAEDYHAFLAQWQVEYQALDKQFEGWTSNETLVGKFSSWVNDDR